MRDDTEAVRIQSKSITETTHVKWKHLSNERKHSEKLCDIALVQTIVIHRMSEEKPITVGVLQFAVSSPPPIIIVSVSAVRKPLLLEKSHHNCKLYFPRLKAQLDVKRTEHHSMKDGKEPGVFQPSAQLLLSGVSSPPRGFTRTQILPRGTDEGRKLLRTAMAGLTFSRGAGLHSWGSDHKRSLQNWHIRNRFFRFA